MSTFSKNNPFVSKINTRHLLSKNGSTKKVYHLSLDIENSGLSFNVGDSVAAIVPNNPDVVDEIIDRLKATGGETIYDLRTEQKTTFRDYLLHKANIGKVSFHKLFPVEKTSLPLLELVKTNKPHPEELCRILLPLLPRFYSIASSPTLFPKEIHLTVAHVSYVVDGKMQFGVGSHFLCELAKVEETPIPIYIQPSNHFSLPENPHTPIILIGPGTGIAPFRAFLQERSSYPSHGPQWLIFGERNRKTDFYYEDFFQELEKNRKLRLSLAFSRDQEEKIYVQHKLYEEKKEIWDWILQGAHIYVCGDAKEMAKDVDMTLQKIIHEEGKMIEEDARKYLKTMRIEKRYLLDVY